MNLARTVEIQGIARQLGSEAVIEVEFGKGCNHIPRVDAANCGMRSTLTSARARAVGPYSHGVVSDPFVYLSGQTPLDPDSGALVGGGVGAQTAQCFDNLLAVLADDGLDEGDVVKVNVYLTDMGTFEEMNTADATRFSEPFPARTTIGVAALPLGAAVEIELIARRRNG